MEIDKLVIQIPKVRVSLQEEMAKLESPNTPIILTSV